MAGKTAALVSFAVLLLACCANADYTGSGAYNITVLATSASEVPAITNTTGTGNATVSLSISTTSVCFNILSISGSISSLTAGHIHKGNSSVSGPIVVPLFTSSSSPACVSGNASILADIISNPTQYYFNIHNADYPGGVARAQIGIPFALELDGKAEVPPAGNDTGAVTVTIGYNYVCYDSLVFDGGASTSPLVAGHIHKGDTTTSGPVVVPFFAGTAPTVTCVAAAPALTQDMALGPDQYYANFHSTAFPNGVIRGQLNLGTLNVMIVLATSASEVPALSGNGAKGNATVILTITGNQVCFSNLTISPGVATPNAAHIHQGNVSVAGPVVVPLLGTTFTTSNCVTASPALIAAILYSPTDYYFNLHNSDYPNGVVRGQLGGTVEVPLNSAKEVPAINAAASGSVYLSLSIKYACYAGLTLVGSDGGDLVPSLVAGHVHKGNSTTAGPVVIPLFSGQPPALGCVAVNDSALIGDISDNPQNYYVNVHSSTFPNGIARGQLIDGLYNFVSPNNTIALPSAPAPTVNATAPATATAPTTSNTTTGAASITCSNCFLAVLAALVVATLAS